MKKKSYGESRRKFIIRVFSVSGPSKLSMFGILSSFTAPTPIHDIYYMYYMRKCKAINFAVRLVSVCK